MARHWGAHVDYDLAVGPNPQHQDDDAREAEDAEVFAYLLRQPSSVRWLVEHMRTVPTHLLPFQAYWAERGPADALKLLSSVVREQERR